MLHPNHLSVLYIIITGLLITLFHIPISFSQVIDPRYVDCDQNFTCGDINVGYPFSGENRPSYCGNPGFNLNCQNSDTFLAFEPLTYQVLVADVAAQSLTVARNDLPLMINNTCLELVYNDTINFNIFKYSSNVQKLSLFYGCTSPPGFSTANQFICNTTNGTEISNYFATSTSPGFNTGLVSCHRTIVFRVFQDWNLSNFQSLSEGIRRGFGLQWELDNTICDRCIRSGGRCGYDSESSTSFTCYCTDRPHRSACNNNSTSGIHPWPEIVVGVCVSVLIVVLIGGVWFRYYLRNRSSRSSNIKGALRSLPGSPKEYDYRELRRATNNFDAKSKLGQGGFGAVYKGLLPSENLEIAVKCFLRENMKSRHDSWAELTVINRLRHKHLVRLLGWSHKNGKLLLVYEYMPNGSLDQHLFAGPDKPPLDWNLRYKIISGVASALLYLHNDYDERVVHRDLKASNIMLDSNFNARLGDFGLARVLENDKTSYTEAEGVAGTIGYIAPECLFTGKATQQSDVYAFGAVILEVVCGQRPGTKISQFKSLVEWVWYLHRDGRVVEAVDPRLGAGYVAEEVERLIILGLACSHPIANERPKAQAIVQMLSGTLPLPYVPPFRPAFVWPGSVPIDIDSTTANTSPTTLVLNTVYSYRYISREDNTI